MSKTILITGSTDGIGKLAALQLAKAGNELILHGRGQKKLEAAISEVEAVSSKKILKGYLADFSDLYSVRQMAIQVINENAKIDVLINNAGVYKSPKLTNEQGLDMRIVVNYLAPYLLTEQLLPFLQKSQLPRIINVSSAAQSTVSHRILNGKEFSSEGDTYAQSKLALTMWSMQLVKMHPDITVIPVNPGSLLNTRMVREVYGQYWSAADKGAKILVELAVLDKYQDASGKYFDNDKGTFGRAHPDAYDQQRIESLIKATKDLMTL